MLPTIKNQTDEYTKMHINLTDNEVTDLLLADEWAGWSYQAASELAKHYNEIDWSMGTSTQLDVVEIRCEWGEYADLAEWALEYFGPSCKLSNDEVLAELDGEGIQYIEYVGGLLISYP